jgi:hypothetical protein
VPRCYFDVSGQILRVQVNISPEHPQRLVPQTRRISPQKIGHE